jgi:hypothetical protein
MYSRARQVSPGQSTRMWCFCGQHVRSASTASRYSWAWYAAARTRTVLRCNPGTTICCAIKAVLVILPSLLTSYIPSGLHVSGRISRHRRVTSCGPSCSGRTQHGLFPGYVGTIWYGQLLYRVVWNALLCLVYAAWYHLVRDAGLVLHAVKLRRCGAVQVGCYGSCCGCVWQTHLPDRMQYCVQCSIGSCGVEVGVLCAISPSLDGCTCNTGGTNVHVSPAKPSKIRVLCFQVDDRECACCRPVVAGHFGTRARPAGKCHEALRLNSCRESM